LRRYILPSYGFTKTELRNHLDECLALVPIQQFLKDAAQIFYTLQPLANLPASAQTIKKEKLKNYCSALEKFWSWTHCQTYLWATSSHQVLPEVLPEQELHNLQLPTRPKKLTPSLLHHPKKLREFWLNQRVQIRTCCATSYKWNDAHRSNILCTLGWLRHENGQKRLVLAIKQESPLETLPAFIIDEIGDPYDFEGTIIEILMRMTAPNKSPSEKLWQSLPLRNSPQILPLASRNSTSIGASLYCPTLLKLWLLETSRSAPEHRYL
jgi:hypothetical protein